MKKIYHISIIALLLISIILNVVNLLKPNTESSAIKSSTNAEDTEETYVEETIRHNKEWDEYTRKIGKKYLEIIGDTVLTTEYNTKSVVGSVYNTHDKAIENIYVNIILYKQGEVVSYESDFISKIPAGGMLDFEIYLSDTNFDSYEIEYVSGAILN